MIGPSTNEFNNQISVIVPVYNGEKYLPEAIESILAQTYKNIELIVIDDGSTDNSRDIALSYPNVKYFYQENKGVSAARNLGIQKAASDYISFLDADDLWLPNKLLLQMKALNDDPSIVIVTGYVEQFISPEVNPLIKKKYATVPKLLKGYSLVAILVKRSLFNKTGLFPEDDLLGETIRWFSDILAKDFNIYILPDVVSRRRIHGNNISITSKKKKNSQIIKILKESIDRKRSTKS